MFSLTKNQRINLILILSAFIIVTIFYLKIVGYESLTYLQLYIDSVIIYGCFSIILISFYSLIKEKQCTINLIVIWSLGSLTSIFGGGLSLLFVDVEKVSVIPNLFLTFFLIPLTIYVFSKLETIKVLDEKL